MKSPQLLTFAALAMLAQSSCEKRSSQDAARIAELERKTNDATTRQEELEQELQNRKLASERDSIERERMLIEEDRARLEEREGEIAVAEEAALREREQELAGREVKLDDFQSALAQKESELDQRETDLSDRDRDLAGREAINLQPVADTEPVGDYGTFYDSLSSYGSWFETADYGYVWQPAAVRDANWRPYSRGRWACSDRGWTWISDEPFGWATYHYGRWALLRDRGWIWVPGSEWAPSWVSWRESNSHIGWAPLPPETMAFTDYTWDSTVDSQFGIGAACFTFVETSYFGGSLYEHCLPVTTNGGIYNDTLNVTYCHIKGRQVICGGPRYRDVCDRIGRKLPFYRLEIDSHPRADRDGIGMRPRIRGNRLTVAAPNLNVAWNDRLRPKQVRGTMENFDVVRDRKLSGEISNQFRRSRAESQRKADEKITQLGGEEQFESKRFEQLQDNRKRAGIPYDKNDRSVEIRKQADRPTPDEIRQRGGGVDGRGPDVGLDRRAMTGGQNDSNKGGGNGRSREVSKGQTEQKPDIRPGADTRPQVTPRERPADGNQPAPREREQPNSDPQKQPGRERTPQQRENNRVREDTTRQRQTQEKPREEEPRRGNPQPQENNRQKEADQTRQRQQEQSPQEEQSRKAAMEQQREQAAQRQQEQERAQKQQQQEENRRQQQEQQQREAQRQQQENQRRQEENQRQRQEQEENQRQRQQEENQRQRQQQEEGQRQRQQEDNQRQRQQDESRRQDKDREEQQQRGKNR